MDWSLIIDIAIKLVVGICIAYVIPQLKSWLSEKIGVEKASKIANYITKFVEAAEQTYKKGSGVEKKNYVMENLCALGIEITDDINAMIEAKVFELNKKS